MTAAPTVSFQSERQCRCQMTAAAHAVNHNAVGINVQRLRIVDHPLISSVQVVHGCGVRRIHKTSEFRDNRLRTKILGYSCVREQPDIVEEQSSCGNDQDGGKRSLCLILSHSAYQRMKLGCIGFFRAAGNIVILLPPAELFPLGMVQIGLIESTFAAVLHLLTQLRESLRSGNIGSGSYTC